MDIKRGNQLKWTQGRQSVRGGRGNSRINEEAAGRRNHGNDFHDNGRQDGERRHNRIDSQMRTVFAHACNR